MFKLLGWKIIWEKMQSKRQEEKNQIIFLKNAILELFYSKSITTTKIIFLLIKILYSHLKI